MDLVKQKEKKMGEGPAVNKKDRLGGEDTQEQIQENYSKV